MIITKRTPKENSHRGIYILPNIFTSLNLFFGFYAVIAVINGKFVAGAVAIIIGVLFDILDGKIARATNTTSKFGIEYDSLADLISFGLAPGLMIYLWSLKPLGRIGWLAAFLFMACGALRLARFNSQVDVISSDHFVGLPIPAGASMVATVVLFCHKFGIEGKINPILILVMMYILSFLMVSTIKYNSFKKPELFKKMNFNVLVSSILILIFIAAQPSVALFFLALTYVVSGPLISIKHYKTPSQTVSEVSDANENGSSLI
ncbi:MAG: CDP-diacylglycerol--serine O-phosphatidyltransferase [Desulfobacterales bacterium]|jgi:CDP-diacylglycerol--serine O-phosphatidyltransferase